MNADYYKNIVFRSAMVLCGLVILAMVGCVVYFLYHLAHVMWYRN